MTIHEQSGLAPVRDMTHVVKALNHSIQRAAIDLQYFSGSRHISIAPADDVEDVLSFDLLQRYKLSWKLRHSFFALLQRITEIGHREYSRTVQRDGALDHIFQFSHVTRPRITRQHVHDFAMNRNGLA